MITRPNNEAGYAMPLVIAMSLLLMLLTAVAVTSATTAGNQANRDRQVKTARQVADASLELALFRLNAVMAGETLPCVAQDAAANLTLTGYAAGGEWCAPVDDVAADGSTTRYWLSKEVPVAGSSPPLVTRRVVAQGTYLGQRRRVLAEIQARQGVPGFGIYGISARNTILIENSARIGTSTAPVDVAANGNIEMKNTASVCGNVTPGPGKTLTREGTTLICPGKTTTPATTALQFPTYDAEHIAARFPAPAVGGNDNARLGCSGAPPKDACTQSSSVLWNAGNRQLTLQNEATLTLGGNIYALCRLNLKNAARLYIAPRPAGVPLKIYFDSPANCGGITEQIMIENGWGITSHNADPVTLQLFVRGSTSTSTFLNFKNSVSNSAATPIMLYAPNSDILLENSASLVGGLVGKTVHLKNEVEFDYDPNAFTPAGPPMLVYQPITSRECSPAPVGAPDTGC